MANIDWDAINKKLPTGPDSESKKRRKELFSSFDNGNGILSFSEVEKGIQIVLKLEEFINAKPAIMRAFQIAKNSEVSKRSDGKGDDYIELKEFRFFLLSLRQYFEYYVAFKQTDTDNDHRISEEEFKAAQPKFEKWVGPIEDVGGEFKKIDKNGGGWVLFDEFCDWAISKNLAIEAKNVDVDQ